MQLTIVPILQLVDQPTGLTTSSGGAITYGSAVGAITKLRDVRGGTSSTSVENALTRTPTAYSIQYFHATNWTSFCS